MLPARYNWRSMRLGLTALSALSALSTLSTSIFIAGSFSGCAVALPFFSTVSTEGLELNPDGQSATYSLNNPEILDRGQLSKAIVDAIPLSSASFFASEAHEGQITDLVVNRDGTKAFTVGKDGKVILTELVNNERAFQAERTVLVSSQKPMFAAALSPDERFLAFSQFSNVWVMDLKTRKVTNRLSRVDGRISVLSWDPRGELLALGLGDGRVFLWNISRGWLGGEDTLDAVEDYIGGLSPIVQIIFHPSGRSFFALERDGRQVVWRLVRTDSEMGLRDNYARIDQERDPTKTQVFGTAPDKIQDAWLSNDGSILFVAVKDGTIRRWKVRGLRQLDPLVVGTGSVGAVSGFDMSVDGSTRSILASVGRSHRLRLWCQRLAEDDPDTSSLLKARRDELRSSTKDDTRDILADTLRTDPPKRAPQSPVLGESPPWKTPLGLVRVSGDGRMIWMSQKSGNVSAANLSQLGRSLPAQLCPE